MRNTKIWQAFGGMLVASVAQAQTPARDNDDRRDRQSGDVDSFLSRLMTYDKNKDGSLSKDEITDARLRPLLQRADANSDGVVATEELTALYERESATLRGGPGGPGGPPDGFGGPPGGGFPFGGPGGPGGPGPRGFGGPPQPGQVLPTFLQDELSLTDKQRTELDELQKDVDARLAKILTKEQQRQLTEMRERGPGGRGGPPGGGPGRRAGRGQGGTPDQFGPPEGLPRRPQQ